MKGDFAFGKGTEPPLPHDAAQGSFLSKNQARERMTAAIEGLDARED